MFHAGDTIENPITGERIVFLQTAAETASSSSCRDVRPGRRLRGRRTCSPGREERFQVLRRTLGFRAGKEELPKGRPGRPRHRPRARLTSSGTQAAGRRTSSAS